MDQATRADGTAGRLPHARRRLAIAAHAARSLVKDTSGATAIEYALIGTIISIIIVASLTAIGTNLSGFFTSVAGSLR
jgi:pilus assembly protein Flp/PilA